MADLGQVLSTLLISLAKAQQNADFVSASIAEEYQRNPLLTGLAAPRVRVGQLELELPMMIDLASEGTPNKFTDAKTLASHLTPIITQAAAKEQLDLAPPLVEELQKRLESKLAKVTETSGREGDVRPREAISRQAQETVHEVLLASDARIEPAPLRAVLDAVADHTLETAEIDAGQLPALKVNVLTDDVKEKSSPSSVARLRILLTEEGLEWISQRGSDGTRKHNLTVE
jgi:hypothetical protein